MRVLESCAALRAALAGERRGGRRIALVPTMGNLHAGHLALVREAAGVAECVVATIFVNPFQFGEGEDFASYPRTLERDLAALEDLGVELVLVPPAEEIYPAGPDRGTRVEVPGLGETLCGASRPGFFRGVATVVCILFNIVAPDVALFGEKDYQQLLVVRRMVRDLHLPVEIAAVATVREPDGLAMSSRNAYLDAAERARAPELYRALCAARDAIQAGRRDFAALEARGLAHLAAHGFRPDYFAVRRAADLSVPAAGEGGELRLLAAAWLGRARLIDNLPG